MTGSITENRSPRRFAISVPVSSPVKYRIFSVSCVSRSSERPDCSSVAGAGACGTISRRAAATIVIVVPTPEQR
jgi:hypothetical protein